MAVFVLSTGGTPAGQPAPQSPDLVAYLLTCALVLGLLLIAAWLFRKFLSGTFRARAAARALSIVDVLPLGRRQRLVVVRCYDRTFLLGQGEKEVCAISELDAETPGKPGAQEVPLYGDRSDPEHDESIEKTPVAGAFARLLGRTARFEPAPSLPLSPDTSTRPKQGSFPRGRGILG